MILTAEIVARLLEIALIVWLATLGGFVFYAVLLRGRALRRMLTGPGGRIAPERVGTFFIILVVAGYYGLTAASTGLVYDAGTDSYWMPDIPESLLILLVGGKSVFLAGKFARPANRRAP